MDLKVLAAAATLSLAAAAPVAAQAPDSSRTDTAQTQASSDRDWGWLGLLGLVGLAGLGRRRNEDHRYDATRTTPR